MKYRKLGSSDLEVSAISLGTWLTTAGGIEKDIAIACVNRAFDLGINFIDTANVYGRGASESVLGEALKDRPRDSYVLATKVYFPMSVEDSGLSREQIAKQIDASLGRLRTDHVDLYQCHRYDENTPLEETMEALTRVVQQGKARYIGFSEWSPQNIRDALAMVPEMEKFVSSQPQYSLLWRRPEKEVIPLCAENGISQIVWSPLAQGMLTGKYSADAPPPADSRAASDEMGGFMDRLMRPEVIAAVDRMKPLAQEAGCTMAQFALAWVLREPNIASAIVGASRPEQLDDNAAAAELAIAPALFEQAEAIATAIPRPQN
ncbi:aldo/keto reductase family protein [Parasphingopyxis marina]|uniref:Aldo/keto reductase family protein n=1 Tax=Parasphingopyxis marina TaxID=2761622 RepID=A0A842HZ70_9SPHN|nr:aldo/keto reductase family protein [Parasphingopyxis marina]MBC2776794.1 aldo/keto reductase family protein [Parasphingopyxis marina]